MFNEKICGKKREWRGVSQTKVIRRKKGERYLRKGRIISPKGSRIEGEE